MAHAEYHIGGRYQGEAADDPIADVELNEPNDLFGCLIEFDGGPAILIPVERKVCTDNAAAGDGRYMRNLGENAGIA